VALRSLESIDLSGVDSRLRSVSLQVAVDVRNPLLGPDGAAAVFAPQKGASPGDVAFLEAGLDRFAAVAEHDAGAAGYAATPGSGAAGGAAFGLMLIGAYRAPGAALVCDLVGLDAALDGASLVLTGEGRLDAQTSWGKAPAEVARRATQAGLPCVAIVGAVGEIPSDLAHLFGEVVALAGVAGGGDTFTEVALLLRDEAARAVYTSVR
jgi:glycerate kinase